MGAANQKTPQPDLQEDNGVNWIIVKGSYRQLPPGPKPSFGTDAARTAKAGTWDVAAAAWAARTSGTFTHPSWCFMYGAVTVAEALTIT